jgi:hypothetical protein
VSCIDRTVPTSHRRAPRRKRGCCLASPRKAAGGGLDGPFQVPDLNSDMLDFSQHSLLTPFPLQSRSPSCGPAPQREWPRKFPHSPQPPRRPEPRVPLPGEDGTGCRILLGIPLARIIHEGFVNNPGLPGSQPFPPAAGRSVVVGGHRAVSRCTGGDRFVPDRRPKGSH